MHAYIFTVSFGVKGPFCCRYLDVSSLVGLKSWDDYEIVVEARERIGAPRNEITPGSLDALRLRGALGAAMGPYLHKSVEPLSVKAMDKMLLDMQQSDALEAWLAKHKFGV